MIIGLRRTVLLGTVGTVAAIIVLLPFFTGLAFPLPHSLPVTISDIHVLQDGTAKVSLDIFNQNLAALAVSKVKYDLYADGELVGKGKLDYADVPPTGRPQLLSRQTTTLVSIVDSDMQSSSAYWVASGTVEIGNAFTLGQREFTANFR